MVLDLVCLVGTVDARNLHLVALRARLSRYGPPRVGHAQRRVRRAACAANVLHCFGRVDGGEQKSGDGNSRSMGLGCNTIPAKPQQPVEATYGLARTAGVAGIAKLIFLHELSAQLTCSGRMERQLHRVRQDLNLDAS